MQLEHGHFLMNFRFTAYSRDQKKDMTDLTELSARIRNMSNLIMPLAFICFRKVLSHFVSKKILGISGPYTIIKYAVYYLIHAGTKVH